MAHGPTPHRPNGWGQFFLNFVRTPKRALYTALGVCVLFVLVYPYGAALALGYVWNTVILTLLPSLILIGAVLWGFRLMFRPFMPKKKKKDH